MRRLIVSLLLVVAAVDGTTMFRNTGWCETPAASNSDSASCSTAPRAMASFGVTGMTCSACAASIETALRRLDGVQAAEVSFEKSLAIITFDPTRIRPETLTATVESAGGTKHQFGIGSLPEQGASTPNVRTSTPAEQLTFYSAPLVCAAAPEIGCGSRTKPILLMLGTKPEVYGTWLSRQGTTIAIAWDPETPASQRTEIATSTFGQLEIAAVELIGDDRKQVLKEFSSDALWYGTEALDLLSDEEANIIAARLVRRLEARAAISGETARKLETTIAEVFRKRFTGREEGRPTRTAPELQAAALQEAGSFLDEKTLAALKEVVALGNRPLAGEN